MYHQANNQVLLFDSLSLVTLRLVNAHKRLTKNKGAVKNSKQTLFIKNLLKMEMFTHIRFGEVWNVHYHQQEEL